MKVVTLITIPSPAQYNTCTLILESLRTGFPHSKIEVYVNNSGTSYRQMIQQRVEGQDIDVTYLYRMRHHGEWIEEMIKNTQGELLIVDPDVIMWKEWLFTFETLLAGMYIPAMWNEWAQCVSVPRLHTSFLQIKDCQKLLIAIKNDYPMAVRSPEYAPLRPFMPTVQYVHGGRCFWDTCACLYGIFGGTSFTEQHFECYDHLNSASFVDIMAENMEEGKQFKQAHKEVANNPQLLKGTWRHVLKYYERMNNKISGQLN